MLDNGWHEWFGTLIVFAEIMIGLALILGALTGLAAFGRWLMNANFMLAGTASTNPVMATMAAMLMISYAVAGHVGLDCWLFHRMGTPWGAAPKIPLIDRFEGFAVQLFYFVLPLGFGVLAGQELIASDFVNHFIPLKALGGVTGGALGFAAGGYVVYLIQRAPAEAVFSGRRQALGEQSGDEIEIVLTFRELISVESSGGMYCNLYYIIKRKRGETKRGTLRKDRPDL